MSNKRESKQDEPVKPEAAKPDAPRQEVPAPKTLTTDYRKIARSDAKEQNFPAAIDSEYRVYIAESAYDTMKKHTATTSEVELCGVLIGNVYRDAAGFYLKVDATIEGKEANNYGAQVTFTHQTWEHINGIKDKQYPNQRIVGWYHTHPGFGVFLSGMDVFIQENTFNHPYQIAIVVETKQNCEGCFAWVEGKSTALSRYWVGSREIKLAKGTAEKFDGDAVPGLMGAATQRSGSPALLRGAEDFGGPAPRVSTVITALLMALCGFLLGRMWELGNIKQTTLAALESEMQSLVEFTALNTLAAKDLGDVSEKLKGVSQKLKEKDVDGAAKSVDELAAHLKEQEAAYGKRREAFRQDLEKMESTGLTSSKRQERAETTVAKLYILRVRDLALKDGQPVDVATLSPQQRAELLDLCTTAIKFLPESRAVINQIHPKLIDALLSQKSADEPANTAPAATVNPNTNPAASTAPATTTAPSTAPATTTAPNTEPPKPVAPTAEPPKTTPPPAAGQPAGKEKP